jgi:hypothetical protein
MIVPIFIVIIIVIMKLVVTHDHCPQQNVLQNHKIAIARSFTTVFHLVALHASAA